MLDSLELLEWIIAVHSEAESKLFSARSLAGIEPVSNVVDAHAASAFTKYASTADATAGVRADPSPQRAAKEVAALKTHWPVMPSALKAAAMLS